MEEIWKPVPSFPDLAVSNKGRVMNIHSGSIRKPQFNKRTGYYNISVSKNGDHKNVYIHSLVAEAFLGKRPDKHDVNHIDGNKLNNSVDNLEYCTRSENVSHAYRTGLNKLSSAVRVLETGEVYDSINDCARDIGGSRKNIAMCLNPKYSRNAHMGRHFELVEPTALTTSPKPVRVIETGEVFGSVRDCARHIDGSHMNIVQAIENDRAYKDLHFEFISKEEYDKFKPKKKPFLYDYQMDAVNNVRNGSILNGGVGSGKSRTGLFYYFKENGGWIDEYGYKSMSNKPQDLYIITTAQKRNLGEWEHELSLYRMSTDPKRNPFYNHKIVVDSWNNIGKYKDVVGAFFLFDEDRVTGYGTWVKHFLKIAKNNNWIILSASPGDRWEDYMAVFIANGFFRNKTEFKNEHLVYSRYAKYPKVDGYKNEARLMYLRDRILVDMDFERKTVPHHEDVYCKYDIPKYKDAIRNRWDPFKNEPIQQASGLCYVLRRIVNSDESRQAAVLELLEKHPRAIIFYNHDHELNILKELAYPEGTVVAQYNGHVHDVLPESEQWVYLVNYNAGNSGWNCIKTDCIIFYSQNYSYKVMLQAAGRIDRLNSPYTDLYYYHLKSRSGIDLAISKALTNKKKFNERKFVGWD